MRYFFVSYYAENDSKIIHGNLNFTSETFPNSSRTKEMIDEKIKALGTAIIIILNIQELSEQDYLDFTKEEKGITNA